MAFYMNCPLDEAIGHYLHDQEEAEAKLPICDNCGEPIYDYYYEVEDWKRFCEDCAEEWMHNRRHEVTTE